jgi:hypothetical protein
MTTDEINWEPSLVLYLANSRDARAGAELIRERWPGAELRAVTAAPTPQEAAMSLPDHLWLLGLNPAGIWATGWHAIDPTPDASIVVQVWRLLNPCSACDGTAHLDSAIEEDADGRPYEVEVFCDACCAGEYPPEPPAWLRYLDDAVCERFELPYSLAVWKAVASYGHELGLGLLKQVSSLVPAADDPVLLRLACEGRAILRAREREEGE